MTDEALSAAPDATAQDAAPVPATGPRAGYRRSFGQRYSDFLAILHRSMVFDWYLEVGCRAGRTFSPVRGNTIAVDPFFKAEQNIIGAKRRLFVFQETSDDFYATGFLQKNGIQLSFSFLDGMHLFEYLLRDFMNTEANSHPDGVIALHDCVPFAPGMMSRDIDNLPQGPWTGDVWKLIPILQTYRPDLTVEVLDCRPTGLVLVSGLNPKSTKLKQAYDRIVADWTTVEMARYGVDRFFGSFAPVDPEAYADAGYPAFAKVRRDIDSVAIPTNVTK